MQQGSSVLRRGFGLGRQNLQLARKIIQEHWGRVLRGGLGSPGPRVGGMGGGAACLTPQEAGLQVSSKALENLAQWGGVGDKPV